MKKISTENENVKVIETPKLDIKILLKHCEKHGISKEVIKNFFILERKIHSE